MPKMAKYGQKRVWHGFRLILGFLIDLSCQKNIAKDTIHAYMDVLPQKQKLQIWPQPHVPKMAKYGQKIMFGMVWGLY